MRFGLDWPLLPPPLPTSGVLAQPTMSNLAPNRQHLIDSTVIGSPPTPSYTTSTPLPAVS